MTPRINELVDLIEAAGGSLRPYDPRLDPFVPDGPLRAAIKAGRSVETPTTIELPNDGGGRRTAVDVLMGLLLMMACLAVIGESLNWWNLWPENPRRGDWRIAPLEASKEPLAPADIVPTP